MEAKQEHSLTQNQIDAIFTFTSKKYVKYYDVQLELVDHVASKIEVLMMEDDSLTFESALQKVYKSYGIFGFTKIAEEKMIALNKMWTKRLVSFLSSYLTFPKIVLTLMLTFVFYSVLSLMSPFEVDSLLWQTISYVIVLVATVIHGVAQNRKSKISNHRLTVVDSYRSYSSMAIFWFHIPIQMIGIAPVSPFFCFLTSVVFAFFIITVFGLLFVFPKELEQQVLEEYAHLNLRMA